MPRLADHGRLPPRVRRLVDQLVTELLDEMMRATVGVAQPTTTMTTIFAFREFGVTWADVEARLQMYRAYTYRQRPWVPPPERPARPRGDPPCHS